MKDLTKVFIDLSKCTEEQRKYIEFLTGEKFYVYKFCHLGQSAFTGNIKFFGFNDIPKGYNRTELTYPEFIKLFEGGDDYHGKRYQPLFDHLNQEHGLILHESEMDEIIRIVNNLNSKDNGNTIP